MTCTIYNPLLRILVEKTPGLKRLWVSNRSGILPWKLPVELIRAIPLGYYTQEDLLIVRDKARECGIQVIAH